jgi:hypothetical protein
VVAFTVVCHKSAQFAKLMFLDTAAS